MKIFNKWGRVKKVFSPIVRILYKRNFAPMGASSFVCRPICMTTRYLKMGHNIYIGPNARIEGVDKYNAVTFTPVIELSDGVTIQQNIHLTCANHVSIGANTAIAANVTITDIHHPYDDIEKSIDSQDIIVGEVVIGSDCKLYNNVVILPNVHIGKHVTVGANSVVCSDLPSYSVAVGMPAYIVKRYDFELHKWRKTDSKGNFID